jgi:hypothetical protein
VLRERTAFSQEYNEFVESLVQPPAEPAKEKLDQVAEMERQKKLAEERRVKMDAFLLTWNPKKWAFFEKIWAKGPETSFHPTAAEMGEINKENPKLLAWLMDRSCELLDHYIGAEKKG